MKYVIHDLFNGCTSLESISMSENTQYIGKDAFKGCTSLTKITLPKDITGASSGSHIHGIDTGAFAGCTSLADIYYEGTISDWAGVNQGSGWYKDVPASVIHCIDGDTAINALAATPLTLEAAVAGAVVTFSNKAAGPVTYRVNGGSAQTIANGSSAEINLPAVGDKVAFYGDNATYATDLTNHSEIRCSGGNCYVYGNIMSLISSSDFANATTLTAEYTFMGLFYYNKNIINKSDKRLSLPATTLTSQCYNQMFGGCEGLTEAPALPATTLVSNCYKYMFCDCTGLTTAPELPATSLADSCYEGMFYGCTNLTTAPALPATTLAVSCYNEMFDGCTSLTQAPELPATNLANYCYTNMFYGCTSLETAPELPATSLFDSCYSSMFECCTSLSQAPELPATTLTNYCYHRMFYGCTSLASVPELPATTLADYCYNQMFYGCEGLTQAPALPATTLVSSCYKEMFFGCISLASAPELPATTLADNCYNQMFYGCEGLSTAPALLATTLADSCYYSMFYGCTSLTAAPTMRATTLAGNCYRQMFQGCTSLTTAPTLSATILECSCYQSMFEECTSLTKAPNLPATMLTSACYKNMFYGCRNLNKVTCLATDISATDCTKDWLSGVAITGTFINSADILGWSTGTSGIPSGWTVVNYVAPFSAENLTADNYATVTEITLDSAEGMTNLINLAKKNGDENGKTFEGKTITLEADVELSSGQNFETEFLGTFDGNGKTISGLAEVTALFEQIGNSEYFDAEIKNLIVKGSSTRAGIVNSLYGTISNCVSEVTVNGGNEICAGICKHLESKRIQDGVYITSVIRGCTNKGNITSDCGYIAGICGWVTQGGIIDSCVNEGTITVTGNHSYIGGISGYSVATIINCINKGEVIANNGTNVGGITGWNANFGPKGEISNCYNTGKVTGSKNVGGIVGMQGEYEFEGTIRNCYNKGDVTGSLNVGGVLGNLTTGSIEHNYYLNTTTSFGIGGTSEDDVSKTQIFTTSSLSELLTNLNSWVNTSSNKPLEDKYSSYTFKNWKTGSDGYPTFE